MPHWLNRWINRKIEGEEVFTFGFPGILGFSICDSHRTGWRFYRHSKETFIQLCDCKDREIRRMWLKLTCKVGDFCWKMKKQKSLALIFFLSLFIYICIDIYLYYIYIHKFCLAVCLRFVWKRGDRFGMSKHHTLCMISSH